jgi:hypothetical protein
MCLLDGGAEWQVVRVNKVIRFVEAGSSRRSG